MSMTGLVLWQGISRLDRRMPVVAIATGLDGSTRNRKTGPLAQTWIMRADMEPHDAVREGADAAVCGSCPYRAGNGCYVQVERAPLAVWRAWQRGAYASWDGQPLDVRGLRIGAYGDPAAVPLAVWQRASARALVRTGYTHAWRDLRAQGWRALLMASVDNPGEASLAQARGWRTFRVAVEGEARPMGKEAQCPADGFRITCATCGACNGAGSRASIWIEAHGPRAGLIARQRAA